MRPKRFSVRTLTIIVTIVVLVFAVQSNRHQRVRRSFRYLESLSAVPVFARQSPRVVDRQGWASFIGGGFYEFREFQYARDSDGVQHSLIRFLTFHDMRKDVQALVLTPTCAGDVNLKRLKTEFPFVRYILFDGLYTNTELEAALNDGMSREEWEVKIEQRRVRIEGLCGKLEDIEVHYRVKLKGVGDA